MSLTLDGSNGIILPVGNLTSPSLGSAGAGMYVPSANNLAFITSSQNRITIDSSGTVTIANNVVVSGTVSGTGFSTYLASPPAIGGTTPASGAFTTLSASSTVSGTGFSTYLASPPAIGGTTPASGAFTTLSATGNTTLGDAAGDTLTINGTAVSCPNNLNFDSNTLFIDATNNRIGIGTSIPQAKLAVNLTSYATTPIVNVGSFGVNGLVSLGGATNNSEGVYLGTGNAVGEGIAAGIGFLRESVGWNSALAFYTNNITGGPNGVSAIQEKMRLDSSGNLHVPGGGGISSNEAFGTGALVSNTTGYFNTASGVNALYSNTTGIQNTASGQAALYSNTTGYNNTASGFQALYSNTTGTQNTASGHQALLSNTTGTQNTASGQVALYSNTTGNYNTASGMNALYSNTTGIDNTASGRLALYSNTTGIRNTASGLNALYSNTTGYNNTASGFQAGYGVGTNSNTTGNNNTFIGNESVGASSTASNTITLGNSAIGTLRCQVTTITALSDARDKTDITPLPAGLDFVKALSPVAFIWNRRDGGKTGVPDTGFIAQELLKAQETTGHTIPGLVYDENPDQLEAGYGKLLPVLVKAIQEQQVMIEKLSTEINQLKK